MFNQFINCEMPIYRSIYRYVHFMIEVLLLLFLVYYLRAVGRKVL